MATDIEFICNAELPTLSGFEVAPSNTVTYVGIAQSWARAFGVETNSVRAIDGASFGNGNSPLFVATDADGAVHWMRDVPEPPSNYGNALHVFPVGAEWRREILGPLSPGRSIGHVHGFEIGPDSRARAWIYFADDVESLAERVGEG